MGKIIFTVLFASMFSINVFASNFCDGFEIGYFTGYNKSSNSRFEPLYAPSCRQFEPLRSKDNSSYSSYHRGFDIGYELGLKEGS